MPTTKKQYREMALKSSLARIDRYTVGRPFKEVFEDVKSHSAKCMNVYVRRGGVPARGGSFDIEADSTLLTSRSSETGMRINGAYYMVVDLNAKGSLATEVTAWGSKFNSDMYFDSFASWAKGEKPICPDF